MSFSVNLFINMKSSTDKKPAVLLYADSTHTHTHLHTHTHAIGPPRLRWRTSLPRQFQKQIKILMNFERNKKKRSKIEIKQIDKQLEILITRSDGCLIYFPGFDSDRWRARWRARRPVFLLDAPRRMEAVGPAAAARRSVGPH